MTQLLFVTPDKPTFADMSSEIEYQGGTVSWATSGSHALEIIGNNAVDLVVTDENLGDMTGLDFVRQLLAVNPMINCAAVSSLSKKAYHEASEGLGILMRLSPGPGRVDGKQLMTRLSRIMDPSSGQA